MAGSLRMECEMGTEFQAGWGWKSPGPSPSLPAAPGLWGISTPSPGSLFQGSSTPKIKSFFLVFSWNIPYLICAPGAVAGICALTDVPLRCLLSREQPQLPQPPLSREAPPTSPQPHKRCTKHTENYLTWKKRKDNKETPNCCTEKMMLQPPKMP